MCERCFENLTTEEDMHENGHWELIRSLPDCPCQPGTKLKFSHGKQWYSEGFVLQTDEDFMKRNPEFFKWVQDKVEWPELKSVWISYEDENCRTPESVRVNVKNRQTAFAVYELIRACLSAVKDGKAIHTIVDGHLVFAKHLETLMYPSGKRPERK